VYWSDGDLVGIATDDQFYVLRFNRAAYQEAVAAGTVDPNEGVEDAFEIITDLNENVRTAKWVGDVCIYTTANRLQYLVGEQTYTITHIDPGFFLLGYIARDGRVYLADKEVNVISYALSLSVVEYQTVVLRGDMEAAEELLAQIPEDQLPKIARFLEGQGYKDKALEVSTDPEQRFELALQLNKLDVAYQLAESNHSRKLHLTDRIKHRVEMETGWRCSSSRVESRPRGRIVQKIQGSWVSSVTVYLHRLARRSGTTLQNGERSMSE